MATIINNSLTAEESALRIHNPILYAADPDKGSPIPFAKWFFGIVGRDPVLAENQKIVYALQEDGSAVPIIQPVLSGVGGVPMYNGSPVSLAVAGSYSLTIQDESGAQKYRFPKVDGVNLQGFSGVIAEESQEVSGSLELTYAVIEAATSSFYISTDALGIVFNGSFLKKDVDYEIVSSTTIRLLAATADGFVVLGREMDPTGQIIPVTEGSSNLFVFEDIAAAKAADLQAGDTVTINGSIVAGDKLGGNKYITVFGVPIADDGENYINLDNGNQLQAEENNFLLARYAEVTNNNSTVAGTLNIDLNQGQVHKVTLSENIGSITFNNVNPDSSLTTTVALKITQDAATARTVTYPASIKWAGGTAPVMTATLGAVDRYVFITDDGGVTWDGMLSGQDFS